jgi:hypothetical protein
MPFPAPLETGALVVGKRHDKPESSLEKDATSRGGTATARWYGDGEVVRRRRAGPAAGDGRARLAEEEGAEAAGGYHCAEAGHHDEVGGVSE